MPAVHRAMDIGRRGHREWLQRIFAAPERLAELLVVTDVYAWKLLRRDQRLARATRPSPRCCEWSKPSSLPAT